ncbi:MAG: hypothetical protein IKZ02_03880, partial [Alphaproteobacteria bacterium]|nr:hypothetical protein [Alphaproteobacteria bacterium]
DTWFENITGTISGTGLTVGIKNVKVEDSPKVDIVATATTTENTGIGMTDCTLTGGEYSINATGTATGIVNTMISNSTISDKGISGVNDGTSDSIKGLTIENTTSTGGSDDYDVYYCKSYENVKNDGEQLDSNSNILKCAVGCPCDCAPGYALTPENTCVPVSCAGKLMQLDPLNPPKMTYANGITTIIGDIVVQSDIDFANEEGCDINIAGSLDLNDHTLSNMIGNVTVNNSAENSVKTFAISNGRFENMSNSTVTVTGTEYGLSGVYFLSSQMTVNATATNGVGIFGGVMDNVSGSVNASGLVQGLSGTELYNATLDITTTATATGSINGKTVAGMVNADIRESTINIMATGWDYGILGTQINDSTITEKGIVGLSTSKGAGVKDFTLNGVLSETGTLGDYSVSYCQSYENVTIEGSDAQSSDFKVLKCAPGCACDCTMDSSVCFGDTPICDAATKTCIAPNCSEDKPIWDANSQTCVACITADSTKPYWDGTTCVSSCPSGKRDGYICVTNCPSERPYLSDGVCVSECSGTKLYRDGATCVSACPSDKPSIDADNACRACPNRTPVWDESSQTCVNCESVDSEKPYWYEYWSSGKTNACISEDQLCSEAILDRMGITDDTEGISYTYDANTNTLTINFANHDEYNELSLWDIDLSPCNLVVNNGFVNIGMVEINSLTVNNPEGEYGIGIPDGWHLTVHEDLIGTGKHFGVAYLGDLLTVGGSIIGTAVDVTGSISDSFGGIPNTGVVNFSGGTIFATRITGMNYSEDGYGVINGGGTITANTISYCQNIMNVGTIVGQISCDCSSTGLTCTENPITTCSGSTPVSIVTSEYDSDTDEYAQTEECISCAEFNSSTPYWDDDAQMCTVC